MQIKNKTMAIVITMILVTSMAISIGSLQTTQAVVRNGINYNDANCCRYRCRHVLEWDEL